VSRTWEIRLPWTKPPLSMNDRPKNWAAHARKIASVRRMTLDALVEQAGYPNPCARIDVTLTYYPRDRRRRDPLNLSATQKPCVDALVDWRIVPDDTPQYVTDRLPVIAEPDGDPRLVLRIEEVS
jgi:crossover junction endodeoxyribonuclease RusA